MENKLNVSIQQKSKMENKLNISIQQKSKVAISLGASKEIMTNDYNKLIHLPQLNSTELKDNTTLTLEVGNTLELKQNANTISLVTGENILGLNYGETSTIKQYIDDKIQTIHTAEEKSVNTKAGDYIFISTEE